MTNRPSDRSHSGRELRLTNPFLLLALNLNLNLILHSFTDSARSSRRWQVSPSYPISPSLRLPFSQSLCHHISLSLRLLHRLCQVFQTLAGLRPAEYNSSLLQWFVVRGLLSCPDICLQVKNKNYSLPQATITIPLVRFCCAKRSRSEILTNSLTH